MKSQKPHIVTKSASNNNIEKAVLVGLDLPNKGRREVEDSLDELKQLAETAGVSVEQVEVNKREAPAPNYYIGKGKAEAIAGLCETKGYNLVIFDDDLAPAQVKNLQNLLGVKVIDRTELILDIFAIHAASREGKIQVELAQLKYMLPRLVRAWTHLSRQWSGVGARGPGEKQLEKDRRRVRQQITKLERDLERVHSHRHLQRKRRERIGVPVVALIGYTNAGKTTLFNKLTKSDLPVENKLFTTLDPKLKRLLLPNKHEIIISDTVGFIKKLPHHLVESFKATLEEVYEADLLIHVVSGVNRNLEEQCEVVLNLLKEMDIIHKPIITAVNKIDLLEDDSYMDKLKKKIPGSFLISAKEEKGLPGIIDAVQEELSKLRREIELFVPNKDLGMISKIYKRGNIIKTEYKEGGARLVVEIKSDSIGEFKDWVVKW